MENIKYIQLADKYENKDYILESPIQFCYQFIDSKKDVEITGLLASWLGYGEEKDYMAAIRFLLQKIMDNTPFAYIMSTNWNQYKDDYHCLHKFNTWDNFYNLCQRLNGIYEKHGDLEAAILAESQTIKKPILPIGIYSYALRLLLSGGTCIIPSALMYPDSRMDRFVRWMSRTNSPFDIGIWTNMDKAKLLPDSSYSQMVQANRLGLMKKMNITTQSINRLYAKLNKIFPGDVARADFVFWGLAKEDKDEKEIATR